MTDLQYEAFRDIMTTLMAKSNEELKAMLSDPACPHPLPKLIRTHTALLGDGFQFEPSLNDFGTGRPVMRKWEGDVIYYRDPTKAELDEVICEDETFRFPVAWGYNETTKEYVAYQTFGFNKKEWAAGKRWTMREFLRRAAFVYSAQRGKYVKQMGDHIYFEGFVGNTFHCGS